MGFSKKHICKNQVLYHLKNRNVNSFLRDYKIELLFKADALLLDDWVSRFYEDLKLSEREVRKDLREKYKFISSSVFVHDDDYKSFTSASETLISLLDDDSASWIDIHWVADKFKTEFDDSRNKLDESEKYFFETLRKICIEILINHFDSPIKSEINPS